MKNSLAKILLNIILLILPGMGTILIFSPIFLYWWIHGDYNRYLWIISGPFPYSHFGGGPFQTVLYGGLFLAGILSFTIVFILRKKYIA